MKAYVFESESENSITLIFKNEDSGNIPKDSILLRTIVGIDYDDIMTKHHELMNWEPYKPF